MKIYINKETYHSNPCPKITKEIWDWFYGRLYENFSVRNHSNIKKIHTIHIRINQAYKCCGSIHFYITINKDCDNNFQFHMTYYSGLDYMKKLRYKWMIDFINSGVDIGTTKPIERYEREIRLKNLKSQTRRKVKSLVNDYKTYLRLHEKFNTGLVTHLD